MMTAAIDIEGYQSTTTFESAPEAVFGALTSAGAIACWWAPATGSGVAGGEITLTFDGQEVRIRVDEADRPARVCWTVLASAPLPDWAGTTITFDIAPAGAGRRWRSLTTASPRNWSASRCAALAGPSTSPAWPTTSTATAATRSARPPTSAQPRGASMRQTPRAEHKKA
jgi:uncharacterized protein YndB with AHSA1/START domain